MKRQALAAAALVLAPVLATAQGLGDTAAREKQKREEQAREAENASDTLKEVRLALARIDAGTFGLCENGGEHIEEKRLEAIPWTRYCSAHEAEAATGPGPRRVTL